MKGIQLSIIGEIPGDKRGEKYISLGISPDHKTCLLSRGRHNDFYRLLIDFGGEKTKLTIYEENCRFHGIDLLPDNRILLYGYGYGKQTTESITYGYIYDHEGNLERRIAFGVGIGKVQTNNKGEIWVSYFDEGLTSGGDLEKHGLNCWNESGELIYQFEPEQGLKPMADCFILNVANDRSVWFYYKNDYKLILLLNKKELVVYDPKIKDAQVLAYWRNKIIIDKGDDSFMFDLRELQKNGSSKSVGEFCFADEDRRKLRYDRCFYRGSMIIFEKNKKLYSVDLRNIINGDFTHVDLVDKQKTEKPKTK